MITISEGLWVFPKIFRTEQYRDWRIRPTHAFPVLMVSPFFPHTVSMFVQPEDLLLLVLLRLLQGDVSPNK